MGKIVSKFVLFDLILFCEYFLSDTTGDLPPSRIQQYLGILCDSNTTPLRVPVLASISGVEKPRRLRYHCERSAGVILFLFFSAKTLPLRWEGTQAPLGYCFPPPVKVEHVEEHMTECRAHALIILPDVHKHWFPRASRTTVPAPVLSKAGSFGYPTTRTECAITCTSAMETARQRLAPEAGDRIRQHEVVAIQARKMMRAKGSHSIFRSEIYSGSSS